MHVYYTDRAAVRKQAASKALQHSNVFLRLLWTSTHRVHILVAVKLGLEFRRHALRQVEVRLIAVDEIKQAVQ